MTTDIGDHGYPCTACGAAPTPVKRWLRAPLGDCVIYTCGAPACLQEAQRLRGGGKLIARRLSAVERAEHALR